MKIKKTKGLSVIFAVLLSFTMLFAFNCTASAAETSQTQDGLTASIVTEKDSYNANENIEMTFKVTNTNDYAIQNVSIEALIPDCLTLTDESAQTVKSVSKLGAGESIELSLTAVKLSGEQGSTVPDEGNTDNSENPANGGGNSTDNSDNSGNSTDKAENADSTDSTSATSAVSAGESVNSDNSSVKTGENAAWVFAGLICLLGVLAVAYFVKNKKAAKRSLSVVLSVCIAAGAATAVALPVAASSGKESFTVEKTIKADGEDCTIKACVTYEKAAQSSDDEAVTRGQWVNMLAEKFSMDLSNVESKENPFDDIADSPYYSAIVGVYYYAVLPDEGESFKPDSAATRDFAAYTLNNCLGYVKMSDLTCDDFDSIKYQDAASALVERGYFELEGNKFMPEKAVTKTETEKIIALVEESLASLQIDENHENVIDVSDDAAVIYDDVIQSADGNTVILTVNEETSALKEGDVFFAPDPNNSALTVAYKIDSLSASDGKIIVETSEPDITEMYNEVNIQGVVRGDAGAAVGSNENGKASSSVGAFDWDSAWDKLEELNEKANDFFNPKKHYENSYGLNAEKFRFEGTYTIQDKKGNRIEVEINGGLENPEIKYNINFEINRFNKLKPIKDNYNFYVSLTDKLVFNGKATLISKDCEQGEYTLAKVPVELCPGVSVDVSLVLAVSAQGEITVKYELDNTVGVKIDNKNGVQLINEFSDSQPEVTARVEAKVGIQPKLALSLAGLGEIVSVNAELGAKGSATLRTFSHNDGNLHTDLSLYMYFDIGYGTDSFLKELLELAKQNTSGTKEIINEANSPLKIKMHVENLTEVKECTYRYVSGIVELSGSKGYPLDNVKVSVYDGNNEIALSDGQSNLTSGTGEFGFLIPCKSDNTNYSEKLKFVFSKDGYKDTTLEKTVKTAQDTDLGTVEMTEETGTGGGQESIKTINSGDILTLTGTLKSEYYEINSNNKGTVAILDLDTPFKCYIFDDTSMSLNNDSAEFYIDSVQVSLTNAQNYYGKHISVTGSVMFAHTAHHQRTIVLLNCSVDNSENYKEEFINALLKNEDEWYSNWGATVGYQSAITFTDLNFDGKPELIMQYGGGSMRNNNASAFYYSDNKISKANNEFQNNLTGYYDKSVDKYKIIGYAVSRGGVSYIWNGNFELKFDGTSVNSDYYSSYIAEDENYTGDFVYTYYSGANDYADLTGIEVISESEYNRINEEKLENLVNINMYSQYILCSDWENYSDSEKKQALENAYDSFTYDKY